MLDVRRLRLLCDLSRLGTIAAVAETHTYTPSAVSQQLSALEREAGTALLERTGRRVTLTGAGRVLVTHAETVLAALERTEAALAAASSGPSGELRIGAFPSAISTLLTPALVTLGERHPALDLMVTEIDPAAVPAALLDRRLDVGLIQDYDVVPQQWDPGLDSVPMLDEAVHLAGTGPGTDLSDHRDANWILATPGTLCHTATLQICRAAGFAPRGRHRVDDFGTVLALVAAGQGVAMVPQLATGRLPAGVTLLPLPTRRRTRVAFRRGAASHPAVAAFLSTLPADRDRKLTRRRLAR
ncbi:LysR family transcriptional regulator [Actinoplanes derwentensis]|uniref:DNA-binding transcriptional regulator, LysR family n=1 Tax=Actinoplanes derwentensis TaxID=113562 RepID=A0A1H1UZG8_9ACTN|nr:LysR family transcriptional regulator [Actinoplanes derwentensis]GID89812.1 LysR family transcriptional regulator [Actinoplanes derwentensis]SDS77934.1 DNA-binding transcriptional regulator, LysR family [Actinoplanes derwentensis]